MEQIIDRKKYFLYYMDRDKNLLNLLNLFSLSIQYNNLNLLAFPTKSFCFVSFGVIQPFKRYIIEIFLKLSFFLKLHI